jgi:hypothetical protein
MTPDTLLLPPSFSSLAAALVLASGGQGDSFRENVKHVPLDREASAKAFDYSS